MMIPILSELESRQQWIAFFQRERPYAQIRQPNCRIDLQTTYLQITCFGEQPVRFTLGSKTTLEPVWQIISRCRWSLSEIISGLEGLDSGPSVRDRRVSDWSPDLSVRRSIPREQQLYTEESLGVWPDPATLKINSPERLCALIAWDQIDAWESHFSPVQWLLHASAHQAAWKVSETADGVVEITSPNLPLARFKPRH